jgi:hypothetical protein
MRKPLISFLAIAFWLVQLWWIGSIVRGLQSASDGGTFHVLSASVDGERHDGWGLTFSGEQGQALAITHIVLIAISLLGVSASRGVMWAVSAVVITAWAALFAGNTIWLAQWGPLQWWDWMNIGGGAIVVSRLSLMAPSRLRSGQPSATHGSAAG